MSEDRPEIERLVRELPDAEGARLFYGRMAAEHPRALRLFERDEGLLSDVLALAAWSPFLATTLAQHPDYLAWLARSRSLPRVRATEELGESLGRFALTNSQLEPQVLLARFRRRELLRIYLHDVRRASAMVETTEELSNLADAVLQFALGLAQQELDNFFGTPQRTDARGRTSRAEFSVVALGKLGSRELNYSSDVDLFFLYSDEGETTGKGERGQITNREYFAKLAERVSRIVGQPAGEGAAYRVDLRLRPHGRLGALAFSLAEALRYYREAARPWELQALIRSRASAGSPELFARFWEGVHERVYRQDETVARALSHVRLAKQKIDREHGERGRGFNVKLGRGGIREIEFVAQALQLAHGGGDPWLRAPHTLISLGRLAERGLITERERNCLSDAYVFLRTLEHRVQMEHGLQTHLVPDDPERRSLVARRMHFGGPNALADFERELASHTERVSSTYRRVFAEEEGVSTDAATGDEKLADVDEVAEDIEGRGAPPYAGARENSGAETRDDLEGEPPSRLETSAAATAAAALAPHVKGGADSPASVERLTRRLLEEAGTSLSAGRSLTQLARVAVSLDKSGAELELDEAALSTLVRTCGASEFFGEMLASNPLLTSALGTAREVVTAREHYPLLRAAIDAQRSFGAELAALRRTWSRLLVEIGWLDVAGELTERESNHLQTALAAASLNAGYFIARRELARRYGKLAAGPRIAVLGLGRLGSAGMDYGSDLDVVLVYDPRVPPPLAGLTHDESYARLAELMVTALSSLTRDGYLYRVDLRLRPDGRNGALASNASAFTAYLRERAEVWEWLAYVKVRAVAGDLEFGRAVEYEARRVISEAALAADAERLRSETRRVRERLEAERAARYFMDIKYGPGGMLDVYFAARYLQLRDAVPDDPEDRSTRATLVSLRAAGSLSDEDFAALHEGYALLRKLDRHLRLLVGRSTRIPPAEDHPVLRDLAKCAGYASPAALLADLKARMAAVRSAFDRITIDGEGQE